MNKLSPIRIGVLGVAAIVPMALTNPARSVHSAQILAIAARDPKRAYRFAKKYNIPRVHQTYAALLADPDIDAIYNPLPNSLHAEWTIRALKAGKHVLCEKPMASNAEEAQEMAAVAHQTGRVLSDAFAYRSHPLTAKLKEIIQSGDLGQVYYYDSIRVNLGLFQRDVSVISDLAVHDFSILDYLLGEHPVAVSANGMNHFPGTPENLAYLRGLQ